MTSYRKYDIQLDLRDNGIQQMTQSYCSATIKATDNLPYLPYMTCPISCHAVRVKQIEPCQPGRPCHTCQTYQTCLIDSPAKSHVCICYLWVTIGEFGSMTTAQVDRTWLHQLMPKTIEKSTKLKTRKQLQKTTRMRILDAIWQDISDLCPNMISKPFV